MLVVNFDLFLIVHEEKALIIVIVKVVIASKLNSLLHKTGFEEIQEIYSSRPTLRVFFRV